MAPGNRLISFHDVQELSGGTTRWQGDIRIWRLVGESINQVFPYADSTETCVRRGQREVWRCFGSAISFMREDDANHQGVWVNPI